MSDKETNRNETPWRGRGFKKPYNGTKNFTYQEFIDANKSNVLKLNLREREMQLGKYATKSADMTADSAVDLTNVPGDWKTSWTPAQKTAASLLLQAERKRDLIHANTDNSGNFITGQNSEGSLPPTGRSWTRPGWCLGAAPLHPAPRGRRAGRPAGPGLPNGDETGDDD